MTGGDPTAPAPALGPLIIETFSATAGGAFGQAIARKVTEGINGVLLAGAPSSVAVITVPHATAPNHADSNGHPHAHDSAAIDLAEALAMPGDELLVGNTPRTRSDLNRATSESSTFHRALNRLLRSKAFPLLLDAHSFNPELSSHYRGLDVGLLVSPDAASRDFAQAVETSLKAANYKVRRFARRPVNWILRKSERFHVPSLLIEVSESLSAERIREVADLINAVRSGTFGGEALDNPVNALPIGSIQYRCDTQTQVGLCGIHPGRLYEHKFQRNPPLLDQANGQILGRVRLYNGPDKWGIDDYPQAQTPADFAPAATPAYRLGALVEVKPIGGYAWRPRGAALYTDAGLGRLYVVTRNPAATIGGLPALATPNDFREFVSGPGLRSVVFLKSGCSSCEKVKPHLHALAGLFDNIAAIDCAGEDHEALALKSGVPGFPHLVTFLGGRPVGEVGDLAGLADEAAMSEGESGIIEIDAD